MKEILSITAILAVLSCQDKTPQDKRTENTIKWIETHKKPIKVETFIYDKSNRTYTLFSQDHKVYNTGGVDLELPTVITEDVLNKYRESMELDDILERNREYIQILKEDLNN